VEDGRRAIESASFDFKCSSCCPRRIDSGAELPKASHVVTEVAATSAPPRLPTPDTLQIEGQLARD
jgi:hypothetical protein